MTWERERYEDVHGDPAVDCLLLAVNCLQHVALHIKVEVRLEVVGKDGVVDSVLVTLAQHTHSRRSVDVQRNIPTHEPVKGTPYFTLDETIFSEPLISLYSGAHT